MKEIEKLILGTFDRIPGVEELRILITAYRNRHGPSQLFMLMKQYGGERLESIPYAQWGNFAEALREGLPIQ